MIDVLKNNNLISCSKHSFQVQLMNICYFGFLNVVTLNADRRKAVIIAFLDKTKAFDRSANKDQILWASGSALISADDIKLV